jgi:hypothetical protein
MTRYLIAVPILLVLAFIPGYTLRFHHYMYSLIAFPVLSLPNRVSLALQAFMLGLFLDGVGRWGWAGLIEQTSSVSSCCFICSAAFPFDSSPELRLLLVEGHCDNHHSSLIIRNQSTSVANMSLCKRQKRRANIPAHRRRIHRHAPPRISTRPQHTHHPLLGAHHGKPDRFGHHGVSSYRGRLAAVGELYGAECYHGSSGSRGRVGEWGFGWGAAYF